MRVKYYDYEKYIGWYSDKVINHFKEGFAFNPENYETVGDFVKLVRFQLEPLSSYCDTAFPGDRAVMLKSDAKSVRFYLDEQSKASFSNLIYKYCKKNEVPLLIWLITGGRGEVFHDEGKDLGVTFLFHSREGSHIGRPHVHVIDRNSFAEISIDLNTMKTLKRSKVKGSSKFSGKKLKKAIKFVEENIKDFQYYWNETTNGFEIEMDV